MTFQKARNRMRGVMTARKSDQDRGVAKVFSEVVVVSVGETVCISATPESMYHEKKEHLVGFADYQSRGEAPVMHHTSGIKSRFRRFDVEHSLPQPSTVPKLRVWPLFSPHSCPCDELVGRRIDHFVS